MRRGAKNTFMAKGYDEVALLFKPTKGFGVTT
jgi:hypothetical protein